MSKVGKSSNLDESWSTVPWMSSMNELAALKLETRFARASLTRCRLLLWCFFALLLGGLPVFGHAQTVKFVQLAPSTVVGGTGTTGTVTLSGPAPTGGLRVFIISASPSATVPVYITVGAGLSTGTFAVTTLPVAADAQIFISASANHVTFRQILSVTAPVLTGLTLAQATVTAGASLNGTVTISSAAPASGMVVNLASDNSAASVPSTVTVPSGSTSAIFAVTTSNLSADGIANIQATLGAATFSTPLTVKEPKIASLSLTPTTLLGGTSVTGVVGINLPASPLGFVVNIASDNSSVVAPSTVTVAPGATTATFSITTSAVPANVTVNITASANSISQTASLAISAPTLTAIAFQFSTIRGGDVFSLTVSISSPAPPSGLPISLTADTLTLGLPASLTISGGATAASVQVTSLGVSSNLVAHATANLNGTSLQTAITLTPPIFTSFSATPATVTGGSSSVGAVRIDGAATATGIGVTIVSDNAAVTVPASATIAANGNKLGFAIKTVPVISNTKANITVICLGKTLSTSVSVLAAVPTAITFSPSTVVGGVGSTGTVTISGPAPMGGLLVSLASGSASVSVPPTVLVAAGKTSATFAVSTVATSTDLSVSVSAAANATTVQSPIVVTAPTISSFALQPNSVVGGNPSTATLTISSPAPLGGLQIAVTSNSVVTVPATVTITAGATSTTFAITTSAVAVNTSAGVSVTLNGKSLTSLFTLLGPTVTSVSLNPGILKGSSGSTGTVTISSPAPLSGETIVLSSGNSSVIIPGSAVIPAGQMSTTFSVTTIPVSSNLTALITATANNTSASATLQVLAPSVQTLTVNPTAVQFGQSAVGTVTLDSPAPVGGTLVALSSNTPIAVVPVSVMVVAGSKTATYSISTATSGGKTKATLTATANGGSASATLLITAIISPGNRPKG